MFHTHHKNDNNHAVVVDDDDVDDDAPPRSSREEEEGWRLWEETAMNDYLADPRGCGDRIAQAHAMDPPPHQGKMLFMVPLLP